MTNDETIKGFRDVQLTFQPRKKILKNIYARENLSLFVIKDENILQKPWS